MTRIVLLAVVLAICVGAYYYFFAGEQGLLGGGSYEEAQEDFASVRPAETVWTPEMNTREASAGQSKEK
mgnify:CR=1 FL=1